MAEIFKFLPKKELDARANIAEFIDNCREKLTVFGDDLDWDNWNWKGVVNFTKAGAPSRGVKANQILDQEILPFAKAYIRYQQGHNPTKSIQEIQGIRCLEPALINIKGKADITLLDVRVLDEAAIFAKKTYGRSSYRAGAHIEKIANFLFENKFTITSARWKNPIPRYQDRNRIGEKAKIQREEKLPSDDQLGFMAEMFANDLQDPRDRYTTSMFGLGMCAPGRVSEFQDLSIDCLHEEKDRKGEIRFGLRFYAGKGYGVDIKWISTPFVSIAKSAISRLDELSREGRKLAKWYEDNPSKFYRHENCPNVSEDEPLTAEQICFAMGWVIQPNKSAKSVAFNPSKKWILALKEEKGEITLRDLNNYVHYQLPVEWPWKNKERGIKYSEALVCLRKDELHGNRGVSPVMLWVPNNSQFTSDLGPRKTKNHKSIWERYGYKNLDGSEIKMTSHQLRHLLNTVAQRGDLGQLDIAMWSGRANIHQNRVYNHISEYEVLDKVKGLKGISNLMGPLEKVKSYMPVTLKDLDAIGEGIAHVTEYGFCVHDFSMIPCQKHRDCINCTEQVCIKGDDEKLSRLKMQRDATKLQLEKARQGLNEDYYGADRWYEHQSRTLNRTEELIQILESREIKDGAIVRLSNDHEHSLLKRELSAIESSLKPDDGGLDKDEIKSLLGDDLG